MGGIVQCAFWRSNVGDFVRGAEIWWWVMSHDTGGDSDEADWPSLLCWWTSKPFRHVSPCKLSTGNYNHTNSLGVKRCIFRRMWSTLFIEGKSSKQPFPISPSMSRWIRLFVGWLLLACWLLVGWLVDWLVGWLIFSIYTWWVSMPADSMVLKTKCTSDSQTSCKI